MKTYQIKYTELKDEIETSNTLIVETKNITKTLKSLSNNKDIKKMGIREINTTNN